MRLHQVTFPQVHCQPLRFGNHWHDPERLERFFLDLGPDSPFKRDAQWASGMDGITKATAPFLPLFTNFREAMEHVRKHYQQVRGDQFGRWRSYFDGIPIRKNDFLTDYRNRAFQLIDQTLAHTGVDPDTLPVEYGEPKGVGMLKFHRLVSLEAPLDGVNTRFVSLVRQIHPQMPTDGPFNCNDQSIWWVVDEPSSKVMNRFYRHADKLWTELKGFKKAPHTDETLQQVFERVGELHWMLANLMPFERGSAAIADLVAKSMTDYLGIRTSRWALGKAPDLEAFVTPLSPFKQQYITLFQQKPYWL